MSVKRIAIIGAGNSGIGAFNACREQGLDVVVYEKSDQICGLWLFREEEIEGSASIYKSTTINTSKEMTPYSDFPPPKEFPNYMHNSKMAEYIGLYAQRIGFNKYVKLKHEVINCEPNPDYDETGKWKLTIRDLEGSYVFCVVFDGVMVCTGHNNKPSMPTFKGQDKFKGSIIHSHSYKDSKGYEDKRTVVVGIGNSAGDIAVELSNICSKVYLSTRTGSWICHRVGHKGIPFDAVLLRRSWDTLFKIFPFSVSCSAAEYYLNLRFNHKLYGLKPKHRVFSQHIFVNDDLPKKIMSGFIVIKGDIECFTENGVIFKDDCQETPCDAVVFATGYQISYPFLSESIAPISKKNLNLYKNVFLPNLKHPKTLAFIGLVLPIGAVLPVAELQSRWFALLMSDKLKLPNQMEMSKQIEKRKKWVKSHFPNWEKHALEVYWIPCMDDLANMIGAKPNLFRYFFTDTKLWWNLFFGPSVPYQYRLRGPNSWSEARNAILTVDERIKAPFRTRNII